MTAISKGVEDQGEFVQAFRENVIRIVGNCGETGFEWEYWGVTGQLKKLRKKKEQFMKEQRLAEAYDQRVEEMDAYMKKAGALSREFDNDLVWRLIQTVKVINQNKIEIQFRSRSVMVQRLDTWED